MSSKRSIQQIAKKNPQHFIGTVANLNVLARDEKGAVKVVGPNFTANIHGTSGLNNIELSGAIHPLSLRLGDEVLITRVQDRFIAYATLPVSQRTGAAGTSYGFGYRDTAGETPQPTNVTATIAGKWLKIEWDAIPGASLYQIIRSKIQDQSDAESDIVAETTATFYDTRHKGKDADPAMWYAVIAMDNRNRASFMSDWVQPTQVSAAEDGFYSANLTSAVSGELIIAQSSNTVRTKFVTKDSPTRFEIEINDPANGHSDTQPIANNSILYMTTANGNKVYAKVSSATNQESFWRYTCTKILPAKGINRTIQDGATVINYGVSGKGYIYQTADNVNAPFVSIRTHTGDSGSYPIATAPLELVRMGNLNGNWGYVTDTYGFAVGEYAANKPNITIDPTNGLRIRNYTTTVLLLDTSGNATFAGFTIGADYIKDNGDSFGLASTVSGSDDVRFWAGDTFANRATADFRVYESGTVYAGAGIILDAPNQQVLVGSGTPRVVIDGANKRIRTSTYTSGSQGFTIESDGSAEFNNIKARGEFHSAVFSYNEVHATAGSMLVSKSAGKLLNDVTTQTSPTTFNVDIKDPDTGHVALFAASDILRIKDGSGNDNWLTVSSVSDQTTFYRYVCTKNNGSNVTFRAGAAVVDYGQSGQGYLEMTADNSDGPFYSVKTHAGSPWTTTTERARMGNLKNAFGIGANNYYGFAAGDYAGGNYFRYDPTNGLVIKGSSGSVTLDNDGLHTAIIQIDDQRLTIGGAASRYSSPGTAADDSGIGTITWSDVDNAKVSDGAYATGVTLNLGDKTHWLKLTNFGFDIPSGTTIIGIKVDVLGYTTGFAAVYARIVKGGTISGSDKTVNLGSVIPTSYSDITGNDANDLWGQTWTYSDINSSGFGVALYTEDTAAVPETSYIDHVRISIFYAINSDKALVQTNSNYFDIVRSKTTMDFWEGRARVSAMYDRAMSDVTVGNTTTETSIYSKTITASDLGTTGGLRLRLLGTWLNNSPGGRTMTMRLKFGSTTLAAIGFALSAAASTGRYDIDFVLFNTSTSAQLGNVFGGFYRGSSSTTVIDAYRSTLTSSEDTTADKTLNITVQWDGSYANATLTNQMAWLEILP